MVQRKPRVLMVVPRLNIGGAESYVLTIATALKQQGHHVVVASWGGQMTRILAERDIPHYRVPVRVSRYCSYPLLARVIKKEKIDIVHANSAAAGAAVGPVCQALSIPWIVTGHGVFGDEPRNRIIEQADRVICVSQFVRDCLTKGTRIDWSKLIVIYNGINLVEFTPERHSDIRQQLGIGENDFVVGIVSRITNTNGKGHDDLLRVLAANADKGWRLLIVGKGNLVTMAKLRWQVYRMGLSSQVIFTGHRLDVPKLISVMNVLALPSNFETFGLVAAEGMAMEKPVVAYDIGGLPEVVEQGVTGYLVPRRDTLALATKLTELRKNPLLAKEMGRRGRERVQRLFNNADIVNQIIALYRQILDERERGTVL